jgi:hypothetical protein
VGKLLGTKFHKGIWNIWDRPHFGFFMDVVKEQYYLVGNYDNRYMRWTTFHQERGQAVLEFTNMFHTLRTKMGIKYSEWHLVLKYRGALQRYIQTEMDFLDVSSLGPAYGYIFKMNHKFRHQNKWEFGFANMQTQTKGTIGIAHLSSRRALMIFENLP